MKNRTTGRAMKYGDNVNTDIISPPAYMELPIAEAAKYALSPIDTEFAKNVKPGDIFVAENNLGSGSSRETAPLTLKTLGIQTIIAKSFARIFYRNCMNIGIVAIECDDTDKISQDDILDVDFSKGIIKNETTGQTYNCSKVPEHLISLISCGGLVDYLREKINISESGKKE